MADDTSTTNTDTATSDTAERAAGDSSQTQTPDVPPEIKRALNKANKEAETLRLQLKEFQDRDKSEAEKASDRIKSLETDLASAQRDSLRFKIASKFGVAEDDAELFLTGSDEETLTAQAKRLTERADERKKQGNYVPKEGAATTSKVGGFNGDDHMNALIHTSRTRS